MNEAASNSSVIAPQHSAERRAVLAECKVEHLVELISKGDRDAAAVLITKYEPMLRRRIRSQLSTKTRRLFDSQDVFSTVCRRFDGFVNGKRVHAESAAELLSLLVRIAQHSVVDKGRAVQRLDRAEGEDSEFAEALRLRSESEWRDDTSFEVDVNRCASLIDSEVDRAVFLRWLAGRSHEQIARELGIRPELARKRWQLIRERLKAKLVTEGRL